MGVDSETRVRAEREMVLKSVLDAGRGHRSDPTLNMVRGNVKVSLEHTGDIDWDAAEIQRRLDQVGALDQARAEGFLAGLFMGTTLALEQMMFPDLESLYPEVESDEDLFDGFADVDADAIIEELEDESY
jgi:hypothetical protein